MKIDSKTYSIVTNDKLRKIQAMSLILPKFTVKSKEIIYRMADLYKKIRNRYFTCRD